ncbi:MAG: phosphoribosylanthranilate isomerase [Phycisphaerae bacterium]|nr:phosphoribosylanthranilate isomerase [Phycisphaerae bacterium]
MSSMHVKICGLTDPQQAVTVAQMGADAIGLNFVPSSKRCITPERGAEIVSAVGDTTRTVGLFVDASAEEINTVAAKTGISRVQLHGRESPDIVADIHLPCWKVFHVADEHFVVEIHDWLICLPDGVEIEAVLLDTYRPGLAGGTGETFNWNLVAQMRSEGLLGDLPPLILAGGLTPENVAEAIRVVQPDMVDVAGGVESAPGVKDPRKVQAFLQAAKQS